MTYVSTRGMAPEASFRDILLAGLAPDGGLYMPKVYPQVSMEFLRNLSYLPYHELAFHIMRLFAPDIDSFKLRDMCSQTYNLETFRYDMRARIGEERSVVPLTWLEKTWRRGVDSGLAILELSNGPTLAFKDIALQLLGRLFEYELEERDQTLNILGATSGDTGSAAEYAMMGKPGIRTFMLSPIGRMSPFQTAQMYSLEDPDIFNIAIRGVFDQCQDIVKAVSGDAEFKERYRIGSVNSINWARIAAQVVYYFWGYLRAVHDIGDPVSFAVPTGNFGNICAGLIARQMGLPIDWLILATNENDVLHEFFQTGVYAPRPSNAVVSTSSPSMDIAKASNFERFLFDAVGRDAVRVREFFGAEQFELPATDAFWQGDRFGIVSYSSTEFERQETIRHLWEQYGGTLIDPHTADAMAAALSMKDRDELVIVLETAQPAKFADTIRKAIGEEPKRPPGLEGLEDRPQRVTVMDADVDAVKQFIAKHALL